MGGENYLPHYVSRIERTIDIHGQIPNKRRHRGQSLGMNTVLRFLDADQAVDFRVLSQHRQGKKPQSAVGYRACRKFLASRFDYRERKQLARVVKNYIDARYGNEFRQSRRYSCDHVAIGTFQPLQPIEGCGEVGAVVRNDDRVSCNAIGPAHGAGFQREEPPFLHLSACRENRRGGDRARCTHDRSRRRSSRCSVPGTSRTTVLMDDNLGNSIFARFGRDVPGLGESSILDRLVSELGFRMWESQLLVRVALANMVQ